ncbi:uncharacterized protein LOC111056397 isoform X1 [Nilaparvata lugens]|uniref:uncharacterized protein LOC111056397 isoform X1 n=2 Tax=Nilaparvata lugens TaxID=108931 RepID=UPI00193CF854|nr:uncharacterized protein LOC111056397 isoform X1 [Nilaparvata lugens]
MCDNNSSEKSKCSGKEKVSRCKHGHRKSSTGNAGANGKRASKLDSTERKSQDSKSSIPAPVQPENTCGCEGQDTQRIGSFRKDSASTKELVSERVESSETTLKTGNEINIVPNAAEADNIDMQNCGEGQRRSSSSQRRSSTQLENFDQNQAPPNPEMPCSCNSQKRDTIKDDFESTSNNNAKQDDCGTGQSIKSFPSPHNFRRSSTTGKKSCTFKLPGTVCELPDEDCDNAIQEFAKLGLMNAEEECDDEEYDYANGKRGHYKTTKYRKNPTTVTNLREKIQQYVRNRPDQLKPAPEKLTPYRDPVFTQCFEPIDEELERQLKEEREAAKRLAEEKKLESEVQCYKKVIPFTLPCKTQLEYLDCLGASPLARVKYLEYSKLMKEAESYRRRMPCDWSCEQQREYLDCMGVSKEVKEVLACTEDDDLQEEGESRVEREIDGRSGIESRRVLMENVLLQAASIGSQPNKTPMKHPPPSPAPLPTHCRSVPLTPSYPTRYLLKVKPIKVKRPT